MGIYGQDWASYQSDNPTTTGLDFVFIKATEGLTYANPHAAGQLDTAKKAGLVVGWYHYPHMGQDPVAEADHFLAVAKPQAGQIIVLDWEGYDPANQGISHDRQVAYRDAWLKYVKGKLPHSPVGIYCNTDYWLHVDTTSNCGDFLWIATGGRPAGDPGIQHPWMFHQYSAAGVDHDYCALPTRAALQAWVASFAPKPPAPQPKPQPAPAPAKPTVSLRNLIAAAKTDPGAAQGHTSHPADVRPVEAALRAEGLLPAAYAGDGSFGTKTVAAYAAWQRRLGYKGQAADGIPGHDSLTKLAVHHGFTVTT